MHSPLRLLRIAFGILVFAIPDQAIGQSADRGSNALTPQDKISLARKLMDEGAAAYARGDLEGAREAFAKAWEIAQHRAIAGNLAEVEMRLGQYAQAVEHLKFVIASLAVESQQERVQAETQLAECSRQLGALRIEIDVPAATVRVNGKVVGASPIGEVVLVTPGQLQIDASRPGFESTSTALELKKGETGTARLTLKPIPSAPKTASHVPASTLVPATDSDPVRTIVLVSGAILTIVSTTMGTVYWLSSRDTQDQSEQALRAANHGVAPSIVADNQACKPAYVKNQAACDSLPTLAARYDEQRRWMTAGFIGAGIAALATTATLLLWPTKMAAPTEAARLYPWSSGNGTGLQLLGTF